MREIELSLNQTQKIRLKRALEKLESSSSKANSNSNASVSISDSIPVNHEDGVLKYLSLSLSSLYSQFSFYVYMYVCICYLCSYFYIFVEFLKGTWNFGPQWGIGCYALRSGGACEQARLRPRVAG